MSDWTPEHDQPIPYSLAPLPHRTPRLVWTAGHTDYAASRAYIDDGLARVEAWLTHWPIPGSACPHTCPHHQNGDA